LIITPVVSSLIRCDAIPGCNNDITEEEACHYSDDTQQQAYKDYDIESIPVELQNRSLEQKWFLVICLIVWSSVIGKKRKLEVKDFSAIIMRQRIPAIPALCSAFL
jgi:hypothetical protein